MIVNPGRLKKKIILQKHTPSTDSYANQLLKWSDYMTLWADVNSLFGTEYWAAAAHGQQDTIVFTVRYSKKLEQLADSKQLTEYRIIFHDIAYDIIHYDNINFANKLVKIKAVRR